MIYYRLPVIARAIIAVVFFLSSLAISIIGRPPLWFLFLAVMLFLLGAWRLSFARLTLFALTSIPLIMGLIINHFDFRHPFISRYTAALFTLIAVALCADSVHLDEWIWLIRRCGRRFHLGRIAPVLMGGAVGRISLALTIAEQKTCRKLANASAWGAKSRLGVILDSVAIPFYSAAEAYEMLDEGILT